MCGMEMNASCCKMSGQAAAITPVPLNSPEHAQRLLIVSERFSLDSPATRRAERGNVLQSPPTQFPPGSISILRI